MAFIFADLIVLPIVVAYRKHYGIDFALRVSALMFVTMVIAALIVDGLFGLADLIPRSRPSADGVFGTIELESAAGRSPRNVPCCWSGGERDGRQA